jgi:hypothetical protein
MFVRARNYFCTTFFLMSIALFYLMPMPSYGSSQLYRWEILEKAANFREKKMQKCMAVRIDGTLQYTDEV